MRGWTLVQSGGYLIILSSGQKRRLRMIISSSGLLPNPTKFDIGDITIEIGDDNQEIAMVEVVPLAAHSYSLVEFSAMMAYSCLDMGTI